MLTHVLIIERLVEMVVFRLTILADAKLIKERVFIQLQNMSVGCFVVVTRILSGKSTTFDQRFH